MCVRRGLCRSSRIVSSLVLCLYLVSHVSDPTDNPDVHTSALRALINLSSLVDHKPMLVSSGGLSHVFLSMSTFPGNGDLLSKALLCLWNCSGNDANKTEMWGKDILQKTLSAMKGHPGHVDVQYYGASFGPQSWVFIRGFETPMCWYREVILYKVVLSRCINDTFTGTCGR